MNLCILTPDDIPAVATIHRAVFPQAAISRLGHAAARRCYYSLMSGLHGTVGVGAFEEIHLGVYLENTKAIGPYERIGWQKFFQDGVWRGLMSKRLTT